jgi:hypothetical protein
MYKGLAHVGWITELENLTQSFQLRRPSRTRYQKFKNSGDKPKCSCDDEGGGPSREED